MTTHIFIVNEKTFKYHLEYCFAGTGAKNKKDDGNEYKNADFLEAPKSVYDQSKASEERSIVSMISDISRVRKGDFILFYLEKVKKFYGIFKAASDPFYDSVNGNYLQKELGKDLIFRVLIEPDEVYSEGISENAVLNDINKYNEKNYQICWSLIYRKLSGNRGCSVITEHESEYIFSLLREINKGPINANAFTYNNKSEKIEMCSKNRAYKGQQNSISISDRFAYLLNDKNHSFESHLQAYIIQNYNNAPLKKFLINNHDDVWMGNEIGCGVGEQSIDVMFIYKEDLNVYIRIVELKYARIDKREIIKQLQLYTKWVYQHIVPNYLDGGFKVEIIPTIVARKPKENILNFLKASLIYTSAVPDVLICSTQFISFDFDCNSNKINFDKLF